MIQIEYRGRKYQAENEREMIFSLRHKGKLKQREIGDLVGKSKQRVAQILGPTGRLQFPELDDIRTFREGDEVISFKLGVSISRVATARRKLGLKQSFKVDLKQRQEWLAEYLFDKKPGPEFMNFITERIKELPEGKGKVLEDFYILGLSQSLSDNVNTDSDRVYRHNARYNLKEITDTYPISELIEKGVLIDG